MKRKIILAAAAALIAFSCSVNDLEDTASVCEGSSPEFYADLSSVSENIKTYVDSDLNLRWTADDRISIFTNTYNQEYCFTGKTGDNSGSFKKVTGDDFVTGNSIDRNYAVYPYNEDTGLLESGEMTVTLPAVQSYAEGTFGLGANTMVAVTSGTGDYFLPFKNLCGYLVVKLYGDATVKSVSLKGNDGEKISGTATLTPQYGEAPAVTVSSEGSETITVDCGDGITLGTTKETATEFWFVIPPVTFSKGFTITVTDTEGGVMEKSTTSSKTTVRNVKNSMAAFEVKTEKPSGFEYVDLGLSVKWATCNIGASKPEEYGTYFAWGDVVGQTWNGSVWSGGGFSTSPECELDSNGNLKPEYDAAYVNLGGSWRMPTIAEQQELIDNCTSTWTDDYEGTGVSGRIFTSNKEGYTDKSIFLAAAGYGNVRNFFSANSYGSYWSSTANDDYHACYLYFGSWGYGTGDMQHSDGCSVRPVHGEYIPVTSISLSETSAILDISSTIQLTATHQPENASLFDLNWSSSNGEVAMVNNGLITPQGPGSCIITASVGSIKAECAVTVSAPITEPEYVDLGLSVKWGTCNIGAYIPERSGRYFAWGDVVGQTWDGSSWSGEGFSTSPEYELDTNGNLKPEYDAAYVNLGGSWRMPTTAEQQELIANCTNNWTDDYNGTGVSGRIFTSKKEGYTDKSIFLPAAGNGANSSLRGVGSRSYYWSSTLFNSSSYAWYLDISSNYLYLAGLRRFIGVSIRPVYGEYVPVTSISLSETSASLAISSTKQLTAVHQPENASLFKLSWSSSNEAVATVNANGLVTAVGAGQCTVTASVGTVKAECAVTVTDPAEPEYVDLGLSVKWATYNIGADSPEEYGTYFAWGDVAGQTWNGSSWSGGGFSSYPEYELNANNNLKPEYDAAHVNWGDLWRMPTNAEQQELRNNCTSTWTSDYNGTGVAGLIFTSKKEGYTDKSIFLPAAGHGLNSSLKGEGADGSIWSGTFQYDSYAYFLDVYSENRHYAGYVRCAGLSVRPVYGEYIPVTSISLSETSASLATSSTKQLTAAHQPENSSLFTLSWSSSNEEVATVSSDGLVYAVGAGQCTITASVGTIKAECTVTVTAPEIEEWPE